MKTFLLFTCEHARCEIPKRYKNLFNDHQRLLTSHQGYDSGALSMMHYLAKQLPCKTFEASYSRLLIDLNRSLHHPHLFSSLTRTLPESEKQIIINQFYLPYRSQVEALIRKKIQAGYQLLHIAVHSFTPHLAKQHRTNQIGLLYDPKRAQEKAFCQQWKQQIHYLEPTLVLRFNYPYRGASDGFTTALRQTFSSRFYQGIELEINQAALNAPKTRLKIRQTLAASLIAIIKNFC